MTTRARSAAAPATSGGLLTRLAKNKAGNTIMLTALSLLPLTAMIGSGVDMARIYMTKSRLQQACDAAALAGRKYMTGTTLSGLADTQARAFFDNNFPDGKFGTVNRLFTPTRTADGQVRGAASVRVPMAVMQVFDFNHVDLNVACQARLEVANTDVMMVLDVTGSMAECPNGSASCGGGAGSKIEGLRAAVLDFYDTISSATSVDSRFRMGFVPYSSAVNMGIDPLTNAQLLDANWMVDNWTYQSRVANMDRDGYNKGTTSYSGGTPQTFGTPINSSNCTKYINNQAFTQSSPSSSYTPANTTDYNINNSNPNNAQAAATVYSDTQPVDERRIYDRVTAPYSNNASCTRRWRQATTTYVPNGRFAFRSWDYKPVQYNVANFRAGTSVNVYTSASPPTGTVTAENSYNMAELVNAPGLTLPAASITSSSYDGCVEERETFAQSTYPTIPSNAYDLDVVTTPNSLETRWRPMWPELIYDRNAAAPENNVTTNRSFVTATWCPVASSHLAERNRSQVQTYVDGLLPVGNTFHDLGMAWGVRMINPFGMWAANNATAPNGRPISRHILFMTDGMMVTPPNIYNTHGYEESDRRVSGMANTPNQTDLVNRHNARFQALCNAARANDITVWTIAFGTANPPTLISCANPGKAFAATNTATLRAQFQQIAANIAKLRLSQ